jgi:hypothetical protein
VSLNNLIVRASTTVVLMDGGSPASAVVPVVSWQTRDGVLSTSVVFGPFPQLLAADSVVVSVDGNPVRIPLDGRLSLPAGTTFTYDVSIASTVVAG